MVKFRGGSCPPKHVYCINMIPIKRSVEVDYAAPQLACYTHPFALPGHTAVWLLPVARVHQENKVQL